MISPDLDSYLDDNFDPFFRVDLGEDEDDSLLFDDDEVRDLYAPYPRVGHDWPVRRP